MHILLLILGLMSGLGVLIWRIQAAMHAAREMKEFAKGAANLPRKLAFRRKAGKSGSTLVQDPQEAAVILMLEIARAAGEVTREQKDAIVALTSREFHFTTDEAEEILTQGAWVSSPEAGTTQLIRNMVKVITRHVSHQEVIELDGMLVEISEADGEPKRDQLAVLAQFRKMTGVVA